MRVPDWNRNVLVLETTGGPNPTFKGKRVIPLDRFTRFEDEAPAPVPPSVIEKMRASLPAVVRRDPKERYRATLNKIAQDALEAYRKTGRITWPKSVEDELKVIAWKTGDPALTSLGGVDQLHRQIEALTRHIVETGEMQQKAQDYKKVTLGWSGH